MIFLAELAPVVIAKLNYLWTAADAHTNMHFDALQIESVDCRVEVVMQFCDSK